MSFGSVVLEKVCGKGLVLFGELHGTREIPLMLSDFFLDYTKDFNLCLEIPEDEQFFVDQFFKTGEDRYLLEMPFFSYSECSDGRNSKEYFLLMKKLYAKLKKVNLKVGVFCIDIGEINSEFPVQEQREEKMVENILKHYCRWCVTFVIVGNIHASKKPFVLGKVFFLTMGSLLGERLKSELVSINIVPKSGSYFNNILKKIDSADRNLDLLGDYDLTWVIEKSSACTFMKGGKRF